MDMNTEQIKSIISTISAIDAKIISREVDQGDLEILLFLLYQEFFTSEPNSFIRDYLNVTLNHFITAKSQQAEEVNSHKKVEQEESDLISELVHKRAPEIEEGEN